MTASPKPDYVVEFAKTKPKHTEIKCIQGHYYLYECYSRYDKISKCNRKVSGKMLGTITPNGYKPTTNRKPRRKDGPTDFELYIKKVEAEGPEVVPAIDKNSLNKNLSKEAPAEQEKSEEELSQVVNSRFDHDVEEIGEDIKSSSSEVPVVQNNNISSDNQGRSESIDEINLPDEEESQIPRDNYQSQEQNLDSDSPEDAELTDKGEVTNSDEPFEDNVHDSHNNVGQAETQLALTPTNNKVRETFEESNVFSWPQLQEFDDVEMAAELYLYNKTENMRISLKKHFGSSWVPLYVMAMLRTINGPRITWIPSEYNKSILSYLYPDIPFNKQSISDALVAYGSMHNCMVGYMKEKLQMDGQIISIDGHRMLSTSKNIPIADYGYDSKHRNSKMFNLIYILGIKENGLMADFYSNFAGHTADISGIDCILKVVDELGENTTVVADKGCVSDPEMQIFEQRGIHYVLPLRRGNDYVKGLVPAPNSGDWDVTFNYRNRAILAKTFHEENRNVHVFLDTGLFGHELALINKSSEKSQEEKQNRMKKTVERFEKESKESDATVEKLKKSIITSEKRIETANKEKNKAEEKYKNTMDAMAGKVLEFQKESNTNLEDAMSSEQVNPLLSKVVSAREKVNEWEKTIKEENEDLENKKKKLEEAINKSEKLHESLRLTKKMYDSIFVEKKSAEQIEKEYGPYYSEVYDYIPDTPKERFEDISELGTITLITDLVDATAENIYMMYKKRANIEQFFDTYDNSLGLKASYLRDPAKVNSLFFLNHLSSEMACIILNDISQVNETKNYSFKRFMNTLRKIHAIRVNGNEWVVPKIPDNLINIFSKLNFDPEGTLNSFDWEFAEKQIKERSR